MDAEARVTVSGTNLLQALASKMRWHQERQQLLAQNIANADTPGYSEKDLKPFQVEDSGGVQSVAMMTTSDSSPTSISISSGDQDGSFELADPSGQTNPAGNDVTIEDEMMKVSSNDLDYQTVTALYSRQLGLVRIALGKEA
jgi:flagellar basal-body rod protein FlgB